MRERVDIGGGVRERVAECVGVGSPSLLRAVIWIVGGSNLGAWANKYDAYQKRISKTVGIRLLSWGIYIYIYGLVGESFQHQDPSTCKLK